MLKPELKYVSIGVKKVFHIFDSLNTNISFRVSHIKLADKRTFSLPNPTIFTFSTTFKFILTKICVFVTVQ